MPQHEDLEAERLFDYGMLAPPLAPSPLALTTCQDTRLAGAGGAWGRAGMLCLVGGMQHTIFTTCLLCHVPAGSPLLFSASQDLAPNSLGHNKRLALVPAGFDWATSTAEVHRVEGGSWQPVMHTQAARSQRPSICPGPDLGISHLSSHPQIACQEHWSGWQTGTPHTLPSPNGGVCSTVCTRQGTQQLMRETGEPPLTTSMASIWIACCHARLVLTC